jgi:hypothetical protein
MKQNEKKLIEEGWQRRFIVSEPRLSEMVEIYKETGFEVHLEPVLAVEEPDEGDEECQTCRICFEGREDQYKVIYTRSKVGDWDEEDG